VTLQTPKPADAAETRTFWIWRAKGPTLYIRCKEGVEVTQKDAAEGLAISDAWEDSPLARVVVDLRGMRSLSRDARALYGNRAHTPETQVALLVDSSISRAIGNFFIRLNGGRSVQLFSNEARAWSWLGNGSA